MRQLRISRQLTDPAWPADHARALPLLRALAATQPLPFGAAETERLLHSVVAIAAQYRGQGADWEELLTAGFNAMAECLGRPGQEADYLAWRVRQEVIKQILHYLVSYFSLQLPRQMSINQQLHELYRSKWTALNEAMQTATQDIDSKDIPASPLLLRVGNEEAYLKTDIKLVVFGQETNSWYECFHEDMNAVLGYYDQFFTSGNYKNYGGHFWNGVLRFVTMLQERYPNKNIYLLWNNLVKIGRDAGIGFPSDTVHEVERQEFNVIQDELAILQPTVALFLTGPNYDSVLNEVLTNPQLLPVSEDFSTRQLAALHIPNVGQAFRTYHPGYLWRNDIDHYLQTIIDAIEVA